MPNSKVREFAIARLAKGESAEEVAEKFGYSRTYIYEVLRYPEKNSELHKKLVSYIEEAKGVSI